MQSRKTWCGFFTGLAAGAGAVTYAALKVPSYFSAPAAQILQKVLDSNMTLKNITVRAITPILPGVPLDITIDKIPFTLRSILADDILQGMQTLPDHVDKGTEYAIWIQGAILLTFAAGLGVALIKACKKEQPYGAQKEPLLQNEVDKDFEELEMEEKKESIDLEKGENRIKKP